MNDFFEELSEGAIQLRDKYQFELKTEYAPIAHEGEPAYTLEFYLFIPSSLQINAETYTKTQFYHDQTSFIRYKTPQLSLLQLVDRHHPNAPLAILWRQMEQNGSVSHDKALHELKLFANMVRSRLRDRVRGFITEFRKALTPQDHEIAVQKVLQFCHHIEVMRRGFDQLGEEFFKKRVHHTLETDWHAIDEFISLSIEHYMTGFLQMMRTENWENKDVDAAVSECITEEQHLRVQRGYNKQEFSNDPKVFERLLARVSLLTKYISEVLFLSIERKEPSKKFTQLGASVAAAIAMFVYVALLTWRGFSNGGLGAVVDSTAFIMLSVLLYVLKDRLKEGVRNYSVRLAAKWYPDFTTKIKTPDGKKVIGVLSEYVSFIDEIDLPPEIVKMRSHGFDQDFEHIKRPETVLYVKKVVEIYANEETEEARLQKVNDLFRFNISQFLLKASDAKEEICVLDPITKELKTFYCSKTYPIYAIIKTTYFNKSMRKRIEFDKFRILLDKEGIQRIEKVPEF